VTATIGLLSDRAAVRRLELADVKLTYVVDGALSVLPDGVLPPVGVALQPSHGQRLRAN
jgi:hypothetical protein